MTIQTVADRAGVSVATVSRAFNAPEKVTPATRVRIAQAARALDYQPNASARTLRTQRSRVLGVVLPTLLNPVFAECLQGIAAAAQGAGYAILPLTTAYELAQEEEAVGRLIAANVDGLILVVSNPSTSGALARLRAAGRPYVLAYNRHPAHPCVSVDSEAASAAVVARLAALGHRAIAMVCGTLAASDRAQQRYRGYLQGMAAAGLPAPPLLEVPFVESAVETVRALLAGPARPTALFCSNDLLAIRSLRAAALAGLQVPRELAVVGFDGIALGQDLTPRLSTVVQPNSEIGACSVELLVQALAHGLTLPPEAGVLLPHHLRTGESCGAAPQSTPAP